jgi:hypothetical protein
MLITKSFTFFYYEIQKFYIYVVTYIKPYLHMVKGLQKFEDSETYKLNF